MKALDGISKGQWRRRPEVPPVADYVSNLSPVQAATVRDAIVSNLVAVVLAEYRKATAKKGGPHLTGRSDAGMPGPSESWQSPAHEPMEARRCE